MLKGGQTRLRFSVILTACLVLAVSSFGMRDLGQRTEQRLINQISNQQSEIRELLNQRLASETNPNRFLSLAKSLAEAGELTLARQVLLTANRSHPSSRDSNFLLAWVLVRSGDIPAATAALAAARRLDPIHPFAQELETILATSMRVQP